MFKRKVGEFGEKLAEKYFRDKGYEIIEKNFRTRFGEIDLIAKEGDEIIFIEVKTRTSGSYGLPEEAITSRKQLKLAQTTERYLESHDLVGKNFRIDSLAIEIDRARNKIKFRHFKNVVGDYV